MFEFAISGLCALGVIFVGTGIYRWTRRAKTSRRVAAVLADATPRSMQAGNPDLRTAPLAAWQLELRQILAELQARDSMLRGPIIALACVSSLVGLATASPGWIVAAAVAALVAYLLGGRARRRKRVEEQSLGAIGLLASGLRAGYSVPQAIALVARQSPDPTAGEFSIAAQEISVGVALAEVIGRLAKRNANPDYELVAIIIRVQHEVGGNLAQILDSVGETLRERVELRSQVDALTAQQRLSSLVLTFLPFALLTLLFVVDRSFVEPLFSQSIGRLILALSGVMVFLGWTIMRSIGRVEV